MVRLNLAETDDSGFEDLPRGKYHVALTDGEVRETGENTKHPDNPFWNLEFTVQDGKYEGRKMWTNAMLPPYELYTIKNLLRAVKEQTGLTDEQIDGDLDVELFPEDASDDDTVVLLGDEQLHVIAQLGKAKKGRDGMEIKKFLPYDEDEWVPADDDEVLP